MLCNVKRLLVRFFLPFFSGTIPTPMLAQHIITTFISFYEIPSTPSTMSWARPEHWRAGVFFFSFFSIFCSVLKFTIIEFLHEHFILQSLDEIVTDSLFTSVCERVCLSVCVNEPWCWHGMRTLHVLRRQIPHITISFLIFSSHSLLSLASSHFFVFWSARRRHIYASDWLWNLDICVVIVLQSDKNRTRTVFLVNFTITLCRRESFV